MSTETLFQKFQSDAEVKVFELKHRKTIAHNMGKYHSSVKAGMEQYSNHELARTRASFIKTGTMLNLDKLLLEWESKFIANGGKVIWAQNGQEALAAIGHIAKNAKARMVVKSKSMTTEEIHLNEHLESMGVEPFETDLGEYIVQLAGQKPYHIVTPAMHMSKEDVSDIFTRNLGTEPTTDPAELTAIARRIMREKYTEADIGITGGNFLVADVGGIALTENEGNARLTITFPKIHIAIVGIEKMVPSMMDLDLFWPLLSTSGTGQQVTVYNTILTGPRQDEESDGPQEMVVILLDNGRSKLLDDRDKRQALNCIRCGACLNACPVYRNIGGHTYGTTYSGPIGSVISPQYLGLSSYKHLSYASSLCGGCSSVCPVKIDIHGMLLLNRRQSVEEGMGSGWERAGFQVWKRVMLSRRLMNFGGSRLKQVFLDLLFKNTWSKRRIEATLASKSFNEQWQKGRRS